ncbi:methylated-DNA--[protein]-cysteine S-methyltransferase [bacterium]|nr:methylated-DNA--[protein]-cysteine S-methyltransferase [bacterium]
MDQLHRCVISSPAGPLRIAVDDDSVLCELYFGSETDTVNGAPVPEQCRPVVDQLGEYFAGKRTEFDLRVRPVGTEFRKKVWQALTEIPYGETWTYGKLAKHVGSPQAARAAGAACGANPISIVIPCHRVVGSNGSLTGFGGGIETKRRLLALESDQVAMTL